MGWRLMLVANMTPSIPAWSTETVGILLLFFLSLSHSASQVSALAAQMAGKRESSGWVTLLLLLALVPCAVMQDAAMQETLIHLAFWRGPVTLILLLGLYLSSTIQKKKRQNGKEQTP